MNVFDRSEVVWGQAGLPGTGLTAGEKTTINNRLTALEAMTPATSIGQLTDVDLTGIVSGDLLKWDGTKLVRHTPAAIALPHALPYTIDGGGAVITTGLKYGFQVNHAGTITGWSLGGNPAGAASVAVWKASDGSFPPVAGGLILTMTIAATNAKNQATGLSIPFSAGDWFYFNVGSVTNFTILMASLKATRQVGP